MQVYIDEVDVGYENKHGGSESDLPSMDLAVEYSKAKSNLCSATDKNVTDGQKESKSPDELYKALTDKNRAIEILKRRLTNQQIQLGYYLHKNLATEAVLEFSNKCFPHLAENSTQLSLAMYKFIRDTGGKTRLAQLREKLTDYNNRVHKALLRQEQLIRQGFGFDAAVDICRNERIVSDGDEEIGDDFRYAKKYYKSAKLEMCNQLMGMTMQVRKELEMFRACAENVVKLEEERNALVDRVFSMPVEERYGNLHVAMVDHTQKPDSSTSLRSTVSTSTNTTSAREGHATVISSLGGALQDMESEAIQLLLLSEKQKNEFVIALEEARLENQHLRERLRDLEEAASDERVIMLQEKCLGIEKEVESMKTDLEAEQTEKEMIIKRMVAEIDEKEVNEQNMRLELKTLRASVDLLRNERDSLQNKITTTANEMQCIDQLNQVTSTDDMVTTPSEPVSQQDVNDLTDLVVLQEEQIKDLLSIMSDLNVNETEDEVFTESSASTTEEKTVLKKVRQPPAQSNDSGMYTESKPIIELVEESATATQDNEEEQYHVFYDSNSNFSNQVASENGRIVDGKKQDDKEKTKLDEVQSKLHRSRPRSEEHQRSFIPRFFPQQLAESHRSGLATTSLRVQSFDKDGRSESMQAVLECSSPVDGLLEMNNSSKLHLRLQCTSPQRTESYFEQSNSGDTSCPFCPEKHVSGDHVHPVLVEGNNESRHLSRETKNYLSKQLNKIKSQLQTSKSSMTARKEIVQNLNEIYSQLFGMDDEVMTQTTQSQEIL